jgi:predicted DsbA family dithiol-disulfide isomerase
MHDKLFDNQKALNPEDLIKHAEALGLDMDKFKKCLDSGKHENEIKKDIAEGQKAGVTGTPCSLLGWIAADGKTVKAVKIVKGAQPYQKFKEEIEDLLTGKKK